MVNFSLLTTNPYLILCYNFSTILYLLQHIASVFMIFTILLYVFFPNVYIQVRSLGLVPESSAK